VPRLAGIMTVSSGIAADYELRFGLRPAVVTNAPWLESLAPTPIGHPIRLLHFGLADERRKLEDTITAVQSLDDRFSLDLVLARDNAYRRRLVEMVKTDERIRILPPVDNSRLVRFANDYDVGVFLLPARFPNQVHVLPNKLFDYIQARLAVAIGPSPEMAAIVEAWQCGVVSESFTSESFAATLDRLTPATIARMKQRADAAAHELNAEQNQTVVAAMASRALPRGPEQ
jgi:hypothetical protein